MKTRKSKSIVAAVATASATILISHCHAGSQSEFTVAGSGNWSVPTNWSPNQVPGGTSSSATDALIDRNNTATVNGGFGLTNLDLDNGAINGLVGSSLTVSNSFRWVGGSVGSGAMITANGAATIGSGTPLSNAGTIVLNTTPAAAVPVALDNSGTISLGANTTLELANGSTTSGRYVSSATSSLLRFSYDQNTSATNTHQLTGRVSTAGDVEVVNADLMTDSSITARDTRFTGGQADLRGNAKFSGPVEFNNTTIYAGDDQAVGSITIGGNASLTNVSQLSNDITAASGNDSIQITGAATIDNLLLDAFIIDGSVPTFGQRFVILNAVGGIVGNRATMIDQDNFVDGYVPAYDLSDPPNQVGEFSVDITATQIALVYVPEPTLLLPLALGLMSLRRRRLP